MPSIPPLLLDVIDHARTFTVLSKPNCAQCDATKRRIAKCDATYAELDLAANPTLLDAAKTLGFQSAPVVLTGDGDIWSGYRPDRITEAASRLGADTAA